MWKIEGFSSQDPPLPPSMAPTAHDPSKATRSAFTPTVSSSCPSQYTRLLQFDITGVDRYFCLRFSLHFVPNQNPVLAIGNQKGGILFWDFQRLTAYKRFIQDATDPERDWSKPLARPSWLRKWKDEGTREIEKPDGDPSLKSKHLAILQSEFNARTLDWWESCYNMHNPSCRLKPHKQESITPSRNVMGRKVAWSPGGQWCVMVGSGNSATLLRRWKTDEGHERGRTGQ